MTVIKGLLSAVVAVMLLGACESTPDKATASTGSGGTSTAPGTAMAPSVSGGPRAGSQEDLNKQYGDRVYFDTDKSDIRADATKTLDGWSQWLAKNPSVTMVIEGNCDERGTREYNFALGERRANSVKNYLIARGVNPQRLSTISYGKERPAVLGSTEEAWAKNRRGVAVVN
ncbi:MAG: peptidoglycan-associated lipoprotein Pal [Alphaproteobacteria bacterium]